jgi:putative ABC transport system substrate-binding protein
MTGLVLLIVSFVDPDPKPTWPVDLCCDAQHSLIDDMMVGCALSGGLVMRRRDFITLLGGAAAWPLTAGAQQSALPVVGLLGSASPAPSATRLTGFRKGLSEAGYVEGQNMTVEYRWAEGHYDRLPFLAADLVRRQVTVIFAGGGAVSARAAKAASTTIPIVFANGGDPVKDGLVASLNRPGGNVTGVSFVVNALEAKKLALLHELVPTATVVAVLVNPNNTDYDTQSKDVQTAARTLGLQLHFLKASTEDEIEAAFTALLPLRVSALLAFADAFLASQLDKLVALTAQHSIPAIYFQSETVAAGGLMSYGTNIPDGWRQAGVYAGRILKGDKPADLPVLQPTKFELVINLKTAKALGLTVPPSLLASADEVIE